MDQGKTRYLEKTDEEGNPAGWYWVDPEWLAGRYRGQPRITGPYSTQAVALENYWAYCEAMTI